MPPKTDPTQRPKYRCAGKEKEREHYKTLVSAEEFKREDALCKVVTRWDSDKLARLILSPEGAARGYLDMWMHYIRDTLKMEEALLKDVVEPTDEESQIKAEEQLVENLKAIVAITANKSKELGGTSAKNKLNDTRWGSVARPQPKGEVDRVMRIWDEVEAEWRKLARLAPDAALTPGQYMEVAQFGLEFVHSNERLVAAA